MSIFPTALLVEKIDMPSNAPPERPRRGKTHGRMVPARSTDERSRAMADVHGVSLPPEIAVIGMTTKAIAGGIIGSAIGTVIGGGTWWERVARGSAGLATCYVGYQVVAKIMVGLISIPIPAAYVPTIAEMEPAACLLCGLVGMVVCQALVNAATAVRDHADDYVEHKIDGDGK